MTYEQKSGIEVFQELYLTHVDGLNAARAALLRGLSGRWKHMHSREIEIKNGTLGEADVIGLERSESEEGPGVSLWMFETPDGKYRVSNIVPAKHGDLRIKGYNAALADFIQAVVEPAAETSGLIYDYSKGVESIEDWADSGTAEALHRFSKLANMSTGRAHPNDGQRWISFLILAHRSRAKLDSDKLARWLIESEHWPEGTAYELASEYDLSRTLLSSYEKTL